MQFSKVTIFSLGLVAAASASYLLPKNPVVSDVAPQAEATSDGQKIAAATPVIPYQGGNVMGANLLNVYIMYFGTGFDNICENGCMSADKKILQFFQNIEYTPWYNTLSEYSDHNNQYVHGSINVAQTLYDTNTPTSISTQFIGNYIVNAAAQHFGNDPNGIYVFMFGNSVTAAGDPGFMYGQQWGGYHSYVLSANGTALRLMVLGNDAPDLAAAHELAEMTTDPMDQGLGWVQPGQNEIGDQCFSQATQTVSNFPGASLFSFNVPSIWSNAANTCVLSTAVPVHTCLSKCPAGSSLYSNSFVTPGGKITSPSGKYVLTLQKGGNVVLSQVSNGAVVWNTGTNNITPSSLVMQHDGNLAVYFANQGPWTSNAAYRKGTGPYCLTVQDSGHVGIYDATCTSLWGH